jgi:flagellar basal-body rod protein FlgF
MGGASLYTGMAGLQAVEANMQATAANIANTQTTGYQSVQALFEASPYTGSNAPGGADVVALTPNPDTAPGGLQHTGDKLDVAVSGNAWLQVQTTSGPALTRAGSLQINNAGILTDSGGNPVLNASGQAISLPQLASIKIGADGTISGVPASQPGTPSQVYGQIGVFATPPGQLTPLSGTLFTAPAGAQVALAPNGTLEQGYLNDSNVDPTQAMMAMIADNRSYQLQTNLMKSQSTGGQSLNTLMAQG